MQLKSVFERYTARVPTAVNIQKAGMVCHFLKMSLNSVYVMMTK